MRVALLISGYLRSFKNNIPNIKEKIINKFESVDVYIHVTKNESTEDKYLNNINESEEINYITNTLNPITLIYEPNIVWFENKEKNNLYNKWSKYFKLNQIKNDNEIKFGKYDLVIKYRPDLDLITEVFNHEIKENSIYIPKDSKMDKNKLTNPTDNYVCDILAYGKSKIMDDYFSIYKNLDSLTEEYGNVSETVLFHYLEKHNIPYEKIGIDYMVILSMCNVFAIAGDSGSGKTTLGNILKKYFSNSMMLECDRYHKWERGHEKWKDLTHLNPKANFLTKMSDDIFNLKIGKNIYQVDYDHKNGRFTEKEHIESSDNIIVCGLHSLYVENDSIYNLKIFIDTDEALKKKWKIERDVIERGYNMEKVLKQIEDRKIDYEKYILPQKEKSDIVINFYEEENNLKLKILINKKYEITDALTNLKTKGVDFLTQKNNFFNILIFENFKPLKTQKPYFKLDNYYDYILYFIMNVNYN